MNDDGTFVLISLSSPSVQPLNPLSLAAGLVQEFRSFAGQPRLEVLLNSSQARLRGWPEYMGGQREGETKSAAPWTHGTPPDSPFVNPLDARKEHDRGAQETYSRTSRRHVERRK